MMTRRLKSIDKQLTLVKINVKQHTKAGSNFQCTLKINLYEVIAKLTFSLR